MPDHAENLQTALRTILGASWHVGEIIPEVIPAQYCFVRMSGEIPPEDLDNDDAEGQTFDLEFACDDIATIRAAVATAKTALRALQNWPAELPGVQYVDVENHDQDYIPALAMSDDREEIETLFVKLHF